MHTNNALMCACLSVFLYEDWQMTSHVAIAVHWTTGILNVKGPKKGAIG